MELAIYKDSFFSNDNLKNGGKINHTKTKSKFKKSNAIINENKKHKKTRKKTIKI